MTDPRRLPSPPAARRARHRPAAPATRGLRLAATLSVLTLLGACAALQPRQATVGQTQAELLATWGPPTGRYTLPAGGQRLEYATGPYGRTTIMVDLGADGRVLGSAQVLTEANFAKVRDGMPRDEVLRMFGRPADKAGEYMNRQTWSWRYPTYDCLWMRITFTAEGVVRGGASTLPDPRCDADH